MDVAQQDLSGVIGRGHSLMETSQGILAIGFKQVGIHTSDTFPSETVFLKWYFRIPYTFVGSQ